MSAAMDGGTQGKDFPDNIGVGSLLLTDAFYLVIVFILTFAVAGGSGNAVDFPAYW